MVASEPTVFRVKDFTLPLYTSLATLYHAETSCTESWNFIVLKSLLQYVLQLPSGQFSSENVKSMTFMSLRSITSLGPGILETRHILSDPAGKGEGST